MKKSSRIIENYINQIFTIQDLVRLAGMIFNQELTAVWKKTADLEFRKSYMDLYRDVVKTANELHSQKLVQERIAIMGALDYEWLVAFLGIVCSGNIAVPLDRNDNMLSQKLAKAQLFGMYTDDSVENRKQFAKDYNLKLLTVSYEMNGNDKSFEYRPIPNDEAVIVFTSGTTGDSKGVVLTHKNIIANTKCGVFFLEDGMAEGDTTIPILPATHMLEITVGILTCFYYGATLCFGGGMKYISKSIQTFSPKALVLVPMIVENLYDKVTLKAKKQIGEKKLQFAIRISNLLRKFGIDLRHRFFGAILEAFGGNLSTIVCGGSSLNPEVIKGFDTYGIRILEGYGITECSPVISCNRAKQMRLGTVGVKGPDEFCETRIIDNELCVRGDIVFKQYFNDEEATKKAKKDGWFHTGDICEIDHQGYIHITGRKKNLIILSDGNNVSPEEIEGYFSNSPYIKSLFVRENNNCIVALVHPNFDLEGEGEQTIKDKINKLVKDINQTLPTYKRIRRVVFFNEDFEKTALGKIRRFKYMQEDIVNAG